MEDLIVTNEINRCEHPYEAFVNSDTKYLIVGTVPPHRFCDDSALLLEGDVDWFYGSKDNKFWDILAEVFHSQIGDLKSVESRQQFARSNYLGFVDLFHELYRYKESSSDSDIIPISFKNIFEYVKANEFIEAVLFTSEYVEKLATGLLRETGTSYVQRRSKLKPRDLDVFKLGDREVKWIKLTSPSRQRADSFKAKANEWQRYFDYLQKVKVLGGEYTFEEFEDSMRKYSSNPF